MNATHTALTIAINEEVAIMSNDAGLVRESVAFFHAIRKVNSQTNNAYDIGCRRLAYMIGCPLLAIRLQAARDAKNAR